MSQSAPGREVVIGGEHRAYQLEEERRIEGWRQRMGTWGASFLRQGVGELGVQRSILLFRPLYNKVSRDGGEETRDVTGAFALEAQQFAAVHSVPADNVFIIDNGAGDSTSSVSYRDRARQVQQVFQDWGPRGGPRIRCVALFCHGSWDMIQLGFWAPTRPRGREQTTDDLARHIHSVAVLDEATFVVLYCCLTGSSAEEGLWVTRGQTDANVRRRPPPEDRRNGADSFASHLRDAMIRVGLRQPRVFAHSTRGHTTRNPWIRLFKDPPGSVGEWVRTPPCPLRGDRDYYLQGPFEGEDLALWSFWERDVIRDPETRSRSTLLWRFWHLTPSEVLQYLRLIRPPP